MQNLQPGYVFRALDIRNPCGMVIRNKIEELGIVRKQIAEDAGIAPNYLSMIMDEKGICPSFATDTGPRIVSLILDAELRHPSYLTPAERKNFARRRALVTDAMTLLSIYFKPARQAEDPHALFGRFASMVSFTTYRAAVSLVGEAVLGPLAPMMGDDIVPEGKNAWLGSLHSMRRTSNRALGEMLYEIDRDEQREEIFKARGEELMKIGNRREAMIQMLQGYEGLIQERGEAA